MPKLIFSVFPRIFVFFVIFVVEIAVGLVAENTETVTNDDGLTAKRVKHAKTIL